MMRAGVRNLRLSIITLMGAWLTVSAPAEDPRLTGFKYPESKKVDQVDDYHGTKVADPYRWLEDLDSPETAAWVAAQNQLTFAFLEAIPCRQAIKDRFTQLWNYERFGVPFKVGGRYFYTRNDGLQNQSVYFVADSLGAPPRMLLDPNTLSKDGTVAISIFEVRDDGKLLAYGTSSAGSDWVEIHVRDVDTGNDLPDVVKWVKFSGASWTADGRGFFYSRYDEPPPDTNAMETAQYFQKLYYHVLGTPQSKDALIYERPDQKEWGFGGVVTDDGAYLVISIWKGTEQKNRIYVKDLSKPDSAVTPMLDAFDAEYTFIDNDGPLFWFVTDKDATRQRIVGINVHHPEPAEWQEIVPQADETLASANVVNNQFLVQYMKDAHTVVRRFDLAGKPLDDVALPGIGSAGGFSGKRSDTETFYSYSSFTTPATVYRLDPASGQSTVFRAPKVAMNPADYETTQVFYASKDGTRIPMFVTARKGIVLDGNNPCLLYGYGGFNIPIEPGFSVGSIVWMEMGGIYAVANIRGGGEYGKAWHDAGRLKNKQNVFDDFIAAAEWLIANKYTSTPKLAIRGGSNGGLLVGACMTQRPDLFGAALPAVGVLDMLRFHTSTIGWAWASDYGRSDNVDDFRVQYAYSPLHNIKQGTHYPPTLITTGDHDDRVVPWHSFKYAATLQAAQTGDAPALIRVETSAGHGAGKPTAKQIEEQADLWAFLAKVLNIEVDTKTFGAKAGPTMSSQ